jgi:hypothetical protein
MGLPRSSGWFGGGGVVLLILGAKTWVLARVMGREMEVKEIMIEVSSPSTKE